jgi:hypothetical protein
VALDIGVMMFHGSQGIAVPAERKGEDGSPAGTYIVRAVERRQRFLGFSVA